MIKKTTLMKPLVTIITTLLLSTVYGQVGIGTTTPAPGAILDVYGVDKGLMIPRIHLTGTNDTTTITPYPTVSMLVFNTNDSGPGTYAVSPGYYYWNGSQWVRFLSDGNFWNLSGNDNIISGVHFLGTTDIQDLDIKTNNTNRLKIPANTSQILAMANGTAAAPFYSWSSDTNTGLWRAAHNELALGAGGVEFLRLRAGTSNEIVINENGNSLSTRIESDTEPNMLYVNGANNRIGIKTANPQTTLHIAGNNNTVRIDELNKINNVHYQTNDPMPVYVDTQGNLHLQPSLVQNYLATNLENFLNPAVTIEHASGTGVTANLQTINITLTQASLVQINYQFTVDITLADGNQIVDGASRMYRSWVEVNGSATQIAYDSGSYNCRVDSSETCANTGYYLSGSGFIQLDPGTHTLELKALGFAGTFSYRMVFGSSDTDRLTVTVHR